MTQTITAQRDAAGHFLTRLAAGEARFFADSGPDKAATVPDPHELLNAALAACTAITVRMYAERKGMALDDVQVTINHSEADGVYRLDRQIRLVGTLNDEEKARLMQIADKCPIHKALTGRFEIVTAAG